MQKQISKPIGISIILIVIVLMVIGFCTEYTPVTIIGILIIRIGLFFVPNKLPTEG